MSNPDDEKPKPALVNSAWGVPDDNKPDRNESGSGAVSPSIPDDDLRREAIANTYSKQIGAPIFPPLLDALEALFATQTAQAKHEQRHQPLGVSRWIAVGEEHGYWQHPMTIKKAAPNLAQLKERVLAAIPEEVEVDEPDGTVPTDPVIAADQVRNYTIRQFKAAIEEVFKEEK